MAKVLITAQVEDTAKWERNFRTHADLFRGMGVHNSLYGIGENNLVAVVEDVDDANRLIQLMDSPEIRQAMAEDGVRRDTVTVVTLDRELASMEAAH